MSQLTELSSVKVERRIIEILLTQDNAYDQYSDSITEDIFYSNRHQLIFKAIRHIKTQQPNEAVDLVLVSDVLSRSGKLQDAGGEEYLIDVVSNPLMLMSSDLTQHIASLEDLRMRRELTVTLNDAVRKLSDKQVPANELLHETSDKLANVSTGGVQSKTADMNSMLTSLMTEIEHITQNGVSYLKTGYSELDKVIMPDVGNLWIVAGRPSMGKTVLAENVTRFIAKNTGKASIIFSLEMNRNDMARRMISAEAGIPVSCLKEQFRTEDENARMMATVGAINNMNIHVNDDRNITLAGIKTELAKLHRQHGEIGVVMVDYLQIMHEVIQAGNDKHNAIPIVTRGLRALAQQYNCLVILLSQVNRQCESRPDKRPHMGDLKDSSAIEQDADIITLVYREDKYRPANQPNDNVVEIIVGKNRNGTDRTVRLLFEGQYSRFNDNMMPSYDEHEEIPFY